MIKFYLKGRENYIDQNELKEKDIKDIIWIDLLYPIYEEIEFIEENFNVILPNRQDSEEIESSSRYWEENNLIEINSFFLISDDEHAKNETVSFILKGKLLISIRYFDLKTFDEIQKKYYSSTETFKDGNDILTEILDIRIDANADTIEQLTKDISELRKLVLDDYKNKSEIIFKEISKCENTNMKIRENILDKQRILSSLLKSPKFNKDLKEKFKVMAEDVKSLTEYTQFSFERLEYIHDMFLGALQIKQNKIMKIFTIINVIFLPPTLIASIYGMNFLFMPELKWHYGYIFAITLIIFSALIPILIFKKKGWF